MYKYSLRDLVKRGYIEEVALLRYNSTRDYMGIEGLLEVERVL